MSNAETRKEDGIARCRWASSNPAYYAYHDEEWGRPTRDDRWIFEKICLEGFQSGLSWLTILNKRENFRSAFENFEIGKVAEFDGGTVDRLLTDAGIIRHRGKIESAVNNAKRALELRDEYGSLAAFAWQYEPSAEAHLYAGPEGAAEAPAATPESAALGRELKRRGWSFVGPTTAYAFMQAAGIVNDHEPGCAAGEACAKARAVFEVPSPH